MCGICGFAFSDTGRPADVDRLVRMRNTIVHRGPDGVGLHASHGVALGHTRLSIIDVQGGAQPLSNEDETVWVTFNGEIYNYRELSRELMHRGHRFRTHSDTEVLVHAYEEYGPSFAARLNGIFALAIHDARRRRTVLIRDHFGIKPLFYTVTSEGLFFGSEIKAVLAGAEQPAIARRESLAEYLTFRYVAGHHTFFDGVHRLLPGHLAVFENGTLRLHPYWEPPAGAPDTAMSLDEATELLRGHLDRSVEAQMMSEVPLGTFCSGGIDSGLVTGFAAHHSPHRLHTFSVGFDDRAWDETPLARATATRFDTEHHVITAQPVEFPTVLARLVWHNDEPLSHPNSVPLYVLSQLARRHVTVVLTGEGADELFGGYPRYQIARIRRAFERVPSPARRGLAALASYAPGHRAHRLAAQLRLDFSDSLIFNSVYVDPALVQTLVGIPIEDALDQRRSLLAKTMIPDDPVATLSRYEMLTYLGCALDRMDRMSMANGLEGRVPFLDVPLVEWGWRVASSLKLRRGGQKRVVKALGAQMLPPTVTRAPKSGFGLPLSDWFRGPIFADVWAKLRNQIGRASCRERV